MMCRFGRFLAGVVCVLLAFSLCAGCAPTAPITKPESLATNSVNTDFTSLPKEDRGWEMYMLSVDSDWKENPETDQTIDSLTFTGEAVSFVYRLRSDNTPGGEQMGVRLYLDGVPQPFTVGEAKGIAPCEKPVDEYYFDALRNQTYCIPITFTPVRGHTGDTLPLFVSFTPSPNYKITQVSECDMSNWMQSISFPYYRVLMEADAPEQKSVDAKTIDTGVQHTGEDGRFVIQPQSTSRGHEELLEKYKDKDESEEMAAEKEAGYVSGYTVPIIKLEEGNNLNVTVKGRTTCTPLYRLQVRLDGKAVPLFDGKYYADARLPNTDMNTRPLISLDFDLSPYPGARTVQVVMIPLPEEIVDFKEAWARCCEIHTTRVAWIRYENDEN